MQADQLIKGDELNCVRQRRCAVLLSNFLNYSDIHFSVIIDRFLTWLADATSAGLRQMYVVYDHGIKVAPPLISCFIRSAAIGLDVSPIAAQLDDGTARSMTEA